MFLQWVMGSEVGIQYGPVAQLGERVNGIDEVAGSKPVGSKLVWIYC